MTFLKPFKTMLLLAVFCLGAPCGYSQKTEFRANAYSGLYFFRGSGAASVANISISGPADEPGLFTAYPYGKRSGFSYVLELQAQHITRQRHLFGVGISYEKLQSKVAFDSVWTQMGIRPTTGNVVLTNSFVTINPYVGQRFAVKNISIDVTAGIDMAFSTNVYSEANVKLDKEYTYSTTQDTYPVDIRPRIQLNAYYKRMGLLAGYSFGTKNFYAYDNPNYVNKKAYSNFLRVGLSYRFRSF